MRIFAVRGTNGRQNSPISVRISLALFLSLSFTAPVAAQTALSIEPYAALDGPQIVVQNGVWTVENRAPGSFGTRWKLGESDAAKVARVRFEWKPSPDTKINFFFKIAGKYYAVLLSGTPDVRAGTVVLGRAQQTPLADGWRRVEFPLRAWALGQNPRARSLPIEEILLGNWENEGYLLAGIGGNSVGSKYQIRRLEAVPNAPNAAPQWGAPSLRNGQIVWEIAGGDGVETADLRLRAQGQTFDLTSPFLSVETVFEGGKWGQKLRFDAGAAGISLGDGETLPLEISGAGGARAQHDFRLPMAELTQKPPLPRVQIGEKPQDWNGDFEDNAAGFVGRSAIVERQIAPENGSFALKITNPRTAGRFETQIASSLDVAQFPAFSFDYRCDERVRLDFRFRWSGVDYAVRFLDRDALPKESKVVRLGAIEGARGDGQWNSAKFDLLSALQKARPDATDFKIENFVLSDDNWMGNARGVHIWLDNFHFAPKTPREFTARVASRSLAKTSQVAFAFDQNPRTRLENVGQNGDEVRISPSERGAGLWFLHVKARGENQLWSETATFPVWLE